MQARPATPFMLWLTAVLAAGALSAQQPGMLVSTGWLAEHRADAGLVIIHIEGQRGVYDEGHIEGARFISQSDITVDGERDVGYELPSVDSIVEVLEAAGISDDSHVVIYSQNPLAATRLWLTLDYVGHGDRASIVDGGLLRWKSEERPLSTGTPEAARGSLTARPRADMVVSAEWILERLDDDATLLIDARPVDEYTGADGGMGGRAHPGHIPGAVNMYWEQLILDRQADPVFLPAPQLRERYEEAGAAQAGTLVAYCMLGARASLTYFVGRMLGYDMRFYDGSWHDWGTRDLPYVSGPSRR